MLYLVAHSFFNGQSKNSNIFPLPELHETQFKKNRGAQGTRMRCDMNCVRSKDAHKQLARTSLIYNSVRLLTKWRPFRF